MASADRQYQKTGSQSAYPASINRNFAVKLPRNLTDDKPDILYLKFKTLLHCEVAGRSEDRIQMREKFSAPVQTGPGTHPASCALRTGSFTGVMRPGGGVNHPI
jgi:hypothetical protein